MRKRVRFVQCCYLMLLSLTRGAGRNLLRTSRFDSRIPRNVCHGVQCVQRQLCLRRTWDRSPSCSLHRVLFSLHFFTALCYTEFSFFCLQFERNWPSIHWAGICGRPNSSTGTPSCKHTSLELTHWFTRENMCCEMEGFGGSAINANKCIFYHFRIGTYKKDFWLLPIRCDKSLVQTLYKWGMQIKQKQQESPKVWTL